MTTLADLAAAARDLANDLFKAHATACTQQGGGQPSCLQKEDNRPPTGRPFFAYDPDRLCNACCAYYHAERAAQVLHEMHCLRQWAEAVERSRATAPK